ncbi:unnamed protein product, partial [Mycena citricolor]
MGVPLRDALVGPSGALLWVPVRFYRFPGRSLLTDSGGRSVRAPRLVRTNAPHLGLRALVPCVKLDAIFGPELELRKCVEISAVFCDAAICPGFWRCHSSIRARRL